MSNTAIIICSCCEKISTNHLNQSKEKLIRFNEKIASKYKAGLSFKYLRLYLENKIVPETIKEFYLTCNPSKQVNSSDFENLLKSKTPKKIDWFFDKIINSREISDYQIRKNRKNQRFHKSRN